MKCLSHKLFLGLMFALLAAGCQPTGQLATPAEEKPPPERTLVYVIHGDGSYLYHEDNQPRQADQETLREARHVAQNAADAEVLIFHQKPLTYRFGLFPRADGAFYHYRSGQLVAEESYRRDVSGHGLSEEAALYRSHRSETAGSRTFLYFGHELPDQPDGQYHQSHSDATFGIEQLAEGLQDFEQADSEGDKLFNLIVLSTCSNGTPGTVAQLAPSARYVLASPEELHLTYFHSEPLHDVTPDESIRETAERMARHSFDRLQQRTHTAVTVALYDTDQLEGALNAARDRYEQQLADLSGSPAAVEYVDCTSAGFDMLAGVEGVDVWFRPARFGAQSDRSEHSGWGCPVTPGWLSDQ